jgi:hypothetical protein
MRPRAVRAVGQDVGCNVSGAAGSPACTGFTVGRAGTYYVVVKGADDLGRRYSVSLTSP